MSSLRLALKQSLEEAGPTLTSDENKAKRKGKKRGPKKRKRKSKDRGEEDEDSGMLHSTSHNSLQLDLLRKIKSASSIGGDSSIIKGSKSGRSVNSRERKHSSSESDSDDGDDSESSSSSDEETGSNSDSGNSSSSGSSSGSENDSSDDEQPTEDMKGVFDSERSSDEEGDNSPEKRPQKKVALEDSDDDDDSDEDSDNDEEMIHPSQRFKLKKVNSSTASLNSRSRSQSPVNIQGVKIRSHQSVSSAMSTSSSKKDKRTSDSEKPKKRKQKTVPAPADQVIAWVMGMSEQKQRRKVRVGMRVKVRFTNPTLQWYGGVITTVSAKGDKIRIKYDDGTKEQSRFPDKEIFVDAENNGEHAPEVQGVVKAFRPKVLGMAIGAINIKQKKEKKNNNKSLHEQDRTTNTVMEVSSPKIEIVEKVEKVEEKMDVDTFSSGPDKEIESPPKQESSTNNFPTSPKQPLSEEIKDPEPSTENNAFQKEAKVEADENIPKETKPEAEQKSAPFVEPASKEKSQDKEENLEHHGDKTNTIDHKDQNSSEPFKPEIELKSENKDTKSESESTRDILPPKTDIVEEKPNTKAQLETDVPNVSLEKEHESVAVAKEDIVDKQIETEPSRNVAESIDAFSDTVSNKDVEKDIENENESMSDDEGEVKKPGRGRKSRKHKLSSVDGSIEEKKSKKRRKDKDLLGHKKKDKDDVEDWVQCDVCSKWRLIPSVKNLPDKWYCELNITDPARSYCSAPEQTPEQVAKERKKAKKAAKKLGRPRSTSPAVFPKRGSKDGSEYDSGRHSPSIEKSMSDESMEEVTSKPGRKKKRTSIQSSVDDEESDPEAMPTPQPKRGRRGRRSNEEKERERRKKKEKEEKQQEWVQCEKCEKWRRLPRHIAAKDLPDKWFCSMNDWDPRSASCAVQEDYKVEDEKIDDNAIVSRNEKGAAVGGSKLTYRNLIRRPTRPITERIRAAESIFSTWAHEADGEQSGNPPVVFYANSSVFHKKTPHHKVTDISHQLDTVPKISLFNMMSNSKLWSDLSQGFSNKVFENDALSLAVDALKQSDESSAEVDIMKAMIFFVLKNSQKTADEILLACQMEYWEDKKFMELSASLTYDIVLAILNQLQKDNLVLVSQGEDQIIRFQRFQTGEKKDNGNRQKDVENKYSARSMKFSKPWKRAKSNSN